MSEINSKLFREDPAAYYTELGVKAERERIIKLLEGYALQKCDDLCAYQCECYGKFEAKGFIELIKGQGK